MPKKTIASSNAVKLGVNDVDSGENKIKFICEFSNYQVFMKVLDENGKPSYHTDAHGNNKVVDTFSIKFTPVSGHKNADGKIDPTTAFCFYVADRDILGKDFDRVVEKLDKECKNPRNKMYREDDHFKKRNPEAFRIASEKAKMEAQIEEKAVEIAEKDKEIEDLRKQLFGRKKG